MDQYAPNAVLFCLLYIAGHQDIGAAKLVLYTKFFIRFPLGFFGNV